MIVLILTLITSSLFASEKLCHQIDLKEVYDEIKIIPKKDIFLPTTDFSLPSKGLFYSELKGKQNSMKDSIFYQRLQKGFYKYFEVNMMNFVAIYNLGDAPIKLEKNKPVDFLWKPYHATFREVPQEKPIYLQSKIELTRTNRPALSFFNFNAGFSLASFKERLTPDFSVIYDHSICLDSKKELHSKDFLLLDPGRDEVNRKSLRKMKRDNNILFFDWKHLQDLKGFQYEIVYTNGAKDIKIKSFTRNSRVMFELMTDVPIKGWKIKEMKVNAHNNGSELFAKYYTVGKNQKSELKETPGLTNIHFYKKIKQIKQKYTSKPLIKFIACYTNTNLKPFFKAAIGDEAQITGFEGRCVAIPGSFWGVEFYNFFKVK